MQWPEGEPGFPGGRCPAGVCMCLARLFFFSLCIYTHTRSHIAYLNHELEYDNNFFEIYIYIYIYMYICTHMYITHLA